MENERGRPTISPWIMATRSALPFLVLACILLGSVLTPYGPADGTRDDSMTPIERSTGNVANEGAFEASEQGRPGNSQECIATTGPLGMCPRFRPRNVAGLNIFSGGSDKEVFAADNILNQYQGEIRICRKSSAAPDHPPGTGGRASPVAPEPIFIAPQM